MQSIPIKKMHKTFITDDGRVIKVVGGKEIRVQPFLSKKSKIIHIPLKENKNVPLINLMIQNFGIEVKSNQKIRYKATKDLRIPLNKIKIITISELSDKENSDYLINAWNCASKASTANRRHDQIVTPVDVLKTLQMHSFKCVYCGTPLLENNWHLDHYQSLHKGGMNTLENIVPSCPTCNIMKGALVGREFYLKCKVIAENFLFKESDF